MIAIFILTFTQSWTVDNNLMHAQPDLRVVLTMDDRWFGLGEPRRYPP